MAHRPDPNACEKPLLDFELLFTPGGDEAGWWSPRYHGLTVPTKGADRPEGLKHLLAFEELPQVRVTR